MCRFVAYQGAFPLFLGSLIDHHEHSLIVQSRRAKETRTGLNADGFGVGWFDDFVKNQPAILRSVQPAWNDSNLCSVASVVRSRCFIGHVRASTVGDVNAQNCHPFTYDGVLCAHNGTVEGFSDIRRHIYSRIHQDDILHNIHGNTDSEHLFALCASLRRQEPPSTPSLLDPLRNTILQLRELQAQHASEAAIRANILMSAGDGMLALRYGSATHKPPISMYYSYVQVKEEGAEPIFQASPDGSNGIVMASECLTEDTSPWKEVPANHFLLANQVGEMEILPF